MTPIDHAPLTALCAQMQLIQFDLAARHAGVCVLHLEAAIAALESRLMAPPPSLAAARRTPTLQSPVW